MNKEEMARFDVLLEYAEKNTKSLYNIRNGKTEIKAYLDTIYESDNDLELEDKDYEEFFCVVFKKVSDGTLFEINYHNLPESVYDGKTRII